MATAPGDDPWKSRPLESQIQALRDEDLGIVVVEEDVDPEGVATAVESKIRATVKGFVQDLTKGIAVSACGCKLTHFPMSSFTRTWVMRLDLSSNKLTDEQANALGRGGCWARELSLANNRLSVFPSIASNFPALIRLDLSDNEFDCLDGLEAATPPSLVDLDISGCSLEGLLDGNGTSPLTMLISLKILNLSANEIEQQERLSPLEGLVSVLELRVEDNPCAEEYRCKTYIKQKMPWLLRLDGDSLKKGIDVGSAAASMSDNIQTILDFNKDSSSCSCLEGNACTTPEGCTDWKRRYDVSRAVRRRMGFKAGDDDD